MNDLRMRIKEALDNLWAKTRGRFDGVEERIRTIDTEIGDVVKSISLNGTNVPKDASGNVALQEADPTVPAWAKAQTKPAYTAGEVGALPEDTFIPTKVSDLTNDLSYQTAAQVSSAISTAVSSVYRYKGSVATVANLPTSGNTVGDVYDVQENGRNYAWTGTEWDSLGGLADVSGLWAKDELIPMTTTEIDAIMDEGDRGTLSMLFFNATAAEADTPMGAATGLYASNLTFTATAIGLGG